MVLTLLQTRIDKWRLLLVPVVISLLQLYITSAFDYDYYYMFFSLVNMIYLAAPFMPALLLKKTLLNVSQNRSLVIYQIFFIVIALTCRVLTASSSMSSALSDSGWREVRGMVLNGELDIYSRLTGYLCIASTILFIRQRLQKDSFLNISFVIISGVIYSSSTYGKGLLITNLGAVIAYEWITNKRIINILLLFLVFLVLFFGIEILRGNSGDGQSLFQTFLYYFISPIFGLEEIITTPRVYSQTCFIPIESSLTGCSQLDSYSFSVPWGGSKTNVFGSLGWNIASGGILFAILYSIVLMLYLYFTFKNLSKLVFPSIAVYLVCHIAVMSFYFSPILFNGMFLVIFSISFIDLLFTYINSNS